MVKDPTCLKVIQLWFKWENNCILLVGVYFLEFKLFLSQLPKQGITKLDYIQIWSHDCYFRRMLISNSLYQETVQDKYVCILH